MKISAFSLLACMAWSAAAADGGKISHREAWIPQAPPRAAVMAGYVKLRNSGPEKVRIVSATSADFAKIEFHEMTIERDAMRMRALAELEIEARGSLALKSGGAHLMLFAPVRELAEGDQVQIVFTTDGGDKVPIDFEVKPLAP